MDRNARTDLAAVRPADQPSLESTDASRWPLPIALAWKRAAAELSNASSNRDVAAGRFATVVARTLIALLLPDYLRGGSSSSVDRLLAELAAVPSAVVWSALLDALVTELAHRSSPATFMPEVHSWYLDGDGLSRAAQDLGSLLRGGDGGSATGVEPAAPGVEEQEAVESRLSRLASSLEWLCGYRLVMVVQSAATRRRTFEGTLRLYVGPGSRDVAAEWDAFLVPDAVYLLAPKANAFLDLSPLLAVAPAGSQSATCCVFSGVTDDRHRVRRMHVATDSIDEAVLRDDSREVPWPQWLEIRPRPALFQSNQDRAGVLQVTPTAVELADGDVVADRYEVRGTLGAGGMSTVYRVWDRRSEQEVALKVLHASLADNPTLGERFRREATIMTSLTHPHVVRARHVGQLADGRLFFTMNIYSGSLADQTHASPTIRDIKPWGEQALSALAYLHDRGVIHRDIKPSNLLLDAAGNIRLADFGIAREPAAADRLTGTLHRVGSVAWMAPEQGRERDVTPRADVYSLARVLHELSAHGAAGRRPGQGLNGRFGELIRRMGALDPADRPDAPEALRELCQIPPDELSTPSEPMAEETSVTNVEQAIVGLASRCSSELRDRTEVVDVLSQLVSEGSRLVTSLAVQARNRQMRPSVPPLALSLAHLGREVEGRLQALSLSDDDRAAFAGLRQQLHDRLLTPAARLADPQSDSAGSRARKLDDGFVGDVDTDSPTATTDDDRDWLTELVATDELRRHDAVHAAAVTHREIFLVDLYALDEAPRRQLLAVLWQHADHLVLEGRGGARDIIEAAIDLTDDNPLRQRFKQLLRLFSGDGGFLDEAEVRMLLEASPQEDRRILSRALLIHRELPYRALALQMLDPADLWPVIVHRTTPVEWLLSLWRHLLARVEPSYLKIFFVSVRDNLLRPGSARRVIAVVELMKELYRVDALHEDTYFDLLLAMDEPIRAEARRHGLLVDFDADYVRLFKGFVHSGRTPEQSLEGWAAVPLPVQRRLARRGHFLGHFICHPIDRIALECLRYLVVRESIVEFLKVSRINSRLLAELSREKRLLRRDDARYALVANPKTPANVLLQYIHLLPPHALRELAQSRECNQVARGYARQALHRNR